MYSSYPYTPAAPVNPYQAGLQNVKGFFKKPIVLILAIIYTLMALISLVSSLIQLSSYDQLYRQYGAEYGLAGDYISLIISAAMMILIISAFWIIYLRSLSKSPQASPSAGFTILYVLAIIALVVICLALAIVLIVLLGVTMMGGSIAELLNDAGMMEAFDIQVSGFGTAAAMAIMPIVILIFVIVAAVVVFMIVSVLRFIGSARRSLNSATMYKGGSISTGVFMIIGAIGSLTPLIECFSLLERYRQLGIGTNIAVVLSLISAVLSLVYMILLAVLCFNYYGYCNKVNYNAATASANDSYYGAYGAPAQPPVTPYQPQVNPYAAQQPTYTPPVQQPQAPNYYGAAANTPPAPVYQPQAYTPPYQVAAEAPDAPIAPQTATQEIPVPDAPVVPAAPAQESFNLYSDSSAQKPAAPSVWDVPTTVAPPIVAEPAVEAPVAPVPEEIVKEPVFEAPIAPMEDFAAPVKEFAAPMEEATPIIEEEAPTAPEGIVCPNCGAILPTGSHFCFHCGAKL